jgi:hypothetical protein
MGMRLAFDRERSAYDFKIYPSNIPYINKAHHTMKGGDKPTPLDLFQKDLEKREALEKKGP